MSTTRKAMVFLAITFAISWGVTLTGVALGLNANPTAVFFTLLAMMFGPSIAAAICAFAFERGHVREALGLKWTPNWWWLIAWLGAFLFVALAITITVAFGHSGLADPAENAIAQASALNPTAAAQLRAIPYLDVILVAQAAVLGSLVNIPALVFTEELGWRGYLHFLWRPSGFWRTSLATGVIWGLWHAPAIYFYGLNYPDHRLVGIPMFIVFCTLLAPLMTFVRDRGRSVIAPAILHGMINGTAGFAAIMLTNPAFPWAGTVGIGGFVALALGVFAVALARPNLAPKPAAA